MMNPLILDTWLFNQLGFSACTHYLNHSSSKSILRDYSIEEMETHDKQLSDIFKTNTLEKIYSKEM